LPPTHPPPLTTLAPPPPLTPSPPPPALPIGRSQLPRPPAGRRPLPRRHRLHPGAGRPRQRLLPARLHPDRARHPPGPRRLPGLGLRPRQLRRPSTHRRSIPPPPPHHTHRP